MPTEPATFEIEGDAKPDLDTTIPQTDDGEIEISFVDETPDDQPEPATRRAQNDPADTGPDPIDMERRQWSQREQEWNEREERYARQVADSERRRIATERESATVALDGVDLRIRTAVEAIKAAKAEGDFSAEVDFSNQLADLRRVREQIVQIQGQLPSDAQIEQQFEQWQREARARRPQATQDVGAVPGNELATRYMQANAWMSDPRQAQARDYLLKVDKQLAAEGYDPKSPAHFEEMSRRVAARFPSVGVKMLDGRAVGTQAPLASASRPQSPPVASARATVTPGQNASQRRGQVTLGEADRRMMRAMGLDPSRKDVQQRFAREKLARMQTERR